MSKGYLGIIGKIIKLVKMFFSLLFFGVLMFGFFIDFGSINFGVLWLIFFFLRFKILFGNW